MLQIAASRGSDTDTDASDTSGGGHVVSAVRGQNNSGQCEATLHMQSSNTVSIMSISDGQHQQRRQEWTVLRPEACAALGLVGEGTVCSQGTGKRGYAVGAVGQNAHLARLGLPKKSGLESLGARRVQDEYAIARWADVFVHLGDPYLGADAGTHSASVKIRGDASDASGQNTAGTTQSAGTVPDGVRMHKCHAARQGMTGNQVQIWSSATRILQPYSRMCALRRANERDGGPSSSGE
ncbi:hypothetical protein ColLi_05440 [Colletotrichum liriopes]|uniref:Uncharacterized protein n=1 Tax=Colletotrichum liriopes TaxID=708192 RepID=A0AA37LSB9_9PEZI|nr:hypothetical protein ColLi_05440 [Colletotrichum liriopes]